MHVDLAYLGGLAGHSGGWSAASIWLTAPIRKNRKSFAIASTLFLSFGVYNPSAHKIEEGREDTDHAKRQKAPGDPPDPADD